MDPEITIADYLVAPAPTFEIPPDEERKNLKVEDFAKLCFKHPGSPMGERMWVKVQRITGAGEYEGTLDNDPIIVPMKCGDEVSFKWNNVIEISR
jgi:hypothetical protein